MSAHYFISDAHIAAGRLESEARLFRFLESIRGRADSLYILGDLFEFWFEYGRAIPKHGFHALAELAELARLGTRIHYIKGNHDFWFQDFLRRELDADAHDELDVVIDGRRVFMMHGDVLDRGWVARFFRKLMRSRFNGLLYALIHPDLGIGLATRVALGSRKIGSKLYLSEDMAKFAQAKIAKGFDIVVMGHSHAPELVRSGRGVYANIGDWLAHFTYGVIRDGEISISVFDG